MSAPGPGDDGGFVPPGGPRRPGSPPSAPPPAPVPPPSGSSPPYPGPPPLTPGQRYGPPRRLPRTAEDRRQTRRRHGLLWGSAPVWLTVVVLALAVLAQDASTRAGLAQFERGEARAVRTFDRVDGTNLDWIEEWKTPYNLGTARYADGDWWGALDDLDDALDVVPEDQPSFRCLIQINRAVVLEAWGDDELAESERLADEADLLELQQATDPDASVWGGTTPESLRAESREYAAWAERDYADARQAREDPACEQQSSEEQQQNQDGKDRLEDKEQDADDRSRPEEDLDGRPQPESEDEAEAQRQQELAERNQQAENEAEAERQEQGDEDGSGGSKNW